MYKVPKRKRHKHQVPKVFLYSATMLSVASTSVIPAATVFAESQTPKKANDQAPQQTSPELHTDLSGNEDSLANKTDVLSKQNQAPANAEIIYTIIYKDNKGRIININDKFSAEPGHDISKSIATNVAELTGNWELLDPNAAINAPASNETPIEVVIKQPNDLIVKQDSAPEENADSDKTSEVEKNEQDQENKNPSDSNSEETKNNEQDQNNENSSDSNSEETKNENQEQEKDVEVKESVQNKITIVFQEENLGTVTVRGNKGEELNLSDWLPSGYALAGSYKFGDENSSQSVNIDTVKDSSLVANQIKLIENGSKTQVSLPFYVYGIPGQKINLGIFLKDGYDLVDSNILFENSSNLREVKVAVKSGSENKQLTNNLIFKANGKVIETVAVSGEKGHNLDISRFLPKNFEFINDTDKIITFDDTNSDKELNIQGVVIPNNKVLFVDSSDNNLVGSQEIKNARYKSDIALNLPANYVKADPNESYQVDVDGTHITVKVIKDQSHVDNYIQFKVNDIDFGEKIKVSGKIGDPIDLNDKIPSGYEIDGSIPAFGADQTTITINLKQKADVNVDVTNIISFEDEAGQKIGESYEVSGKDGDNINISSLIPSGYEIVGDAPKFSGSEKNLTIKIKLTTPTSATNYVQFVTADENGTLVNFGNPISVTGNVGSEINLASIMPSDYELSNANESIQIDPSDGKVIQVQIKAIAQTPTPVTNHLHFKIDGNEVANVEINGNLNDNIDLEQYIPSGYGTSSTPKFDSNGSDIDITLQVIDPNAPRNTIQFMNGDVKVGDEFSVYGQNGSQIQLGIFKPFGYAGGSLTIDANKTSRKIDINTGFDIPDAPIEVNNTIQFTIDGQDQNPISVTGQVGNEINISSLIPNGYELVDPSTTVMFESEGTNHKIAIKQSAQTPDSVTNTIKFKTSDGTPVGNSITITGKTGDAINVSSIIPAGYDLVDKSLAPKIGDADAVIEIEVKQISTAVDNILQFTVDGAEDVIPPIQLHGEPGEVVNIADKIPAGYELVDPNTEVKIDATNGKIHKVAVKIISPKPISVKNKIQFKLNGVDVNSPIEVSGNKGDEINLNSWIPTGYKLDRTPVYTDNDDLQTVSLEISNPLAVKNTFQFYTSTFANIGDQVDVYGNDGQAINFGIFMPAGYELIIQDPKIDSTQPYRQLEIQTVGTNPDEVTKTVNLKDHDGNVVASKSYTGAKDSQQDISDMLPENYEWINEADKAITLTDNGQSIDVQVQGKQYNNTIVFIDEDNSVQSGTQAVSGRYNTPITDALKVPTGYKLKNPDVALTLKFGGKDAEIKVAVVKNNDQVTNTIQFTIEGQDQNPISVTGQVGDDINLSSLIPNGYELVDPSTTVKFEAEGTNHKIEIKQSAPTPDSVTNTIKFKTSDGNPVGNPVTITGKTGDEINLASIIPAGYELADKSVAPKIGEADAVIEIEVKQISTAVDNILQFTVDGAEDVIPPIQLHGEPGEVVNLADKIPAGYELVDPSAEVKIDATNGKIHKVAVKRTATPNPISVKNKIQFKLNGANVNSPIEVSGNKGDEINLNVWIPTGYKLDRTPVYTDNDDLQTVNLEIDNPLAVKNTIQFFTSTFANIGDPVDVYGTDGQAINFGIFMPAGYELIIQDPKIDSTQPNRQLEIQVIGGNQTNVTKTVNLKDADGNVVASKSYTGVKDSQQDISDMLPENYEWINDADKTVTLTDNNQTVNIQVQGKVYNNRIIFLDEDREVQAGTQIVTGRYNTQITDFLNVPDGYRLKHPGSTSNLKFGSRDAEIKIAVVKDSTQVTNTIQFVKDGVEQTPVRVSGSLGTEISISNMIPNGYELVDPQTTVKFEADGTNHKVEIKQSVQTPDMVTNTIKFKTSDGTTVGNPVTITGRTGDVINFATILPVGYQLVSHNNVPVIGPAGTVLEFEVKRIITAVDNILQFTVDGAVNVIPPIQLHGEPGEVVNLADKIPAGYELVDPTIEVKIDAINGKIQKVAIKRIANQNDVTKIVNLKDVDGNIVASKSYTGAKDSHQDISNMLPENYEWINETDKTVTLTDDNQPIDVQVQGKEYNNKIIFVDEDNSVQAGTQAVRGRYNTQITDALNVPTGYKLKNPNIASTLKFGGNDAEIKVAVVRDNNQVTNTIQFTKDGVDQTPISVSGQLGQDINISSLIPNGYELVDPSTTVKFDAEGTNHKIAIKQSAPAPDSVTNTIKFKTSDGTPVGNPVTINGKTGDVINFATILPAGYELANKSVTPKIGAAGAVLEIVVKRISTAVDNILQFTVDGADNVIPPIQLHGEPGEVVNLADKIPAGYELVDPSVQVKIDATNGKIQKVAIKRTATPNPISVKNKIQFKLNGANVGNPIEVSGNKGERINLTNWIPTGYELDSTPVFGDNDTLQNVNLKPITNPRAIKNTIQFKDPSGNNVGNPIDVFGNDGDSINLGIFVPNGYDLVDPSIKIDSTKPNRDVALKVNVPTPTDVTNVIKITDAEGTVLKEKTVTGAKNAQQDISDLLPDNYEWIRATDKTVTLSDNNSTITVKVQGKTYSNTISFIDQTVGAVIGTQTITGRYNTMIDTNDLRFPAGYKFKQQVFFSATGIRIGVQGAQLQISVVKDVNQVTNKIQFTVNGVQLGNPTTVSGNLGDRINLTNLIPNGYELVNSSNPVYFVADGIVQNVALKKKTPASTDVQNTIKFKTADGSQIGTNQIITGTPGDVINISSLIPVGYELVNKNARYNIGAANTTIDVLVQKISTAVDNYIQFTVNGQNMGNLISVNGEPNSAINITDKIPAGYELVDKNASIKIDPISGKIIKVALKKKNSSTPTTGTNYLQFTVNGSNYGDQIQVSGNVGSSIKIADYIPKGYELVDKNAEASIDGNGTVFKIAIQKAKTADATTNYIQFKVNGTNFGTAHKVSGNVDEVINLTSLIPSGYELAKTPLTIKFGADGTTHNVELKKSNGTVTNYIQFTIDGQDYSIRIERTGKEGDPIDIIPWIPSGYELVDKKASIRFGANGTVQRIAIQKSSSTTPASVSNWIQFTVNGTNFSSAIKVTGKTGSPINLSSLVPEGYELVNKDSIVNFGNDGDVYKIAIQKIKAPTSTTVKNYIQFTIDGKDYSVLISRTGKLGDVIDIEPWIPSGYTLVDKNLTYRFVEDGTIIRIPIVKIADSIIQNNSETNKVSDISDDLESIDSENNDTLSDTVTSRKQDSLPQTGDDQAQAAALSVLGITTAGTAAVWMSSRKKRSKEIRSTERSSN